MISSGENAVDVVEDESISPLEGCSMSESMTAIDAYFGVVNVDKTMQFRLFLDREENSSRTCEYKYEGKWQEREASGFPIYAISTKVEGEVSQAG